MNTDLLDLDLQVAKALGWYPVSHAGGVFWEDLAGGVGYGVTNTLIMGYPNWAPASQGVGLDTVKAEIVNRGWGWSIDFIPMRGYVCRIFKWDESIEHFIFLTNVIPEIHCLTEGEVVCRVFLEALANEEQNVQM